jgi:hypothetical protein
MSEAMSPLTPAGEALAKEAVAAIIRNVRESSNPQNDPGRDAGRLRAAIADVVRGANPFHSGRYQASQCAAAGAGQIEALRRVAEVLNFGEEIGRGGEHVVFRQPGDRDVQKLTLPEVYGYGYVLDLSDTGCGSDMQSPRSISAEWGSWMRFLACRFL